jgi:ureidoglycolate dehydrogenase (NAD+)
VPMGGHKGFGLALLAEVLASVLPGAALSPDLPPMSAPPGRPFALGHTILVLDPGMFGGREHFLAEAARLADVICSSSADADSAPVRVPGMGAHARELAARQEGLAIPTAVWAQLTDQPS